VVTLLVRVQEILGSNLGGYAGYTEVLISFAQSG
jgi:hypothetical protein